MKTIGRELLRWFAWMIFIFFAWDVLALVKSYEFYILTPIFHYTLREVVTESLLFKHLPIDAFAFYLWWKWK